MEHWFALYTKPHKEHQVALCLHGQGIETYLPTIRRQVRRRDRPRTLVYFPCYVFVRLDLEVTPRSFISWMPGVRQMVSAGNEPLIVADEIIDLVRRRLQGVEDLGDISLIQGDRVRITAGPLRDLEAVFERPLPATHRVRVLLDVMGRMAPVEIDYSQIRKV